LSIIDTISEGFRTLSRRIGLVLIPILLDLFLWQGPKLSVAPVMEKMIAMFEQAMNAAAASGGADSGMMQLFETQVGTLREVIGQLNLMALLAWGRLGMPGIAGTQPIDLATDRVVEITGYGQLLLAQIGLLAWGCSSPACSWARWPRPCAARASIGRGCCAERPSTGSIWPPFSCRWAWR